MDTPGPYEMHSNTAYFNVTLPEKNWTPQHIAEHMSAFNVGTVISTSVHEAYPGHYVQFIWTNYADLSKVRKLIAENIPSAASMCYDAGANQLVIPMNANNGLAFVPITPWPSKATCNRSSVR